MSIIDFRQRAEQIQREINANAAEQERMFRSGRIPRGAIVELQKQQAALYTQRDAYLAWSRCDDKELEIAQAQRLRGY